MVQLIILQTTSKPKISILYELEILQTRYILLENEINLFLPCVAFYIETCHLFFSANQMTGFYMKCSTELEWVELSL